MECSCFGLIRLRFVVRRTPIAGECPTFVTVNRKSNFASPSVEYVSGPDTSTLQESHGRCATKDALAAFSAAWAAMSRNAERLLHFSLLSLGSLTRLIDKAPSLYYEPSSKERQSGRQRDEPPFARRVRGFVVCGLVQFRLLNVSNCRWCAAGCWLSSRARAVRCTRNPLSVAVALTTRKRRLRLYTERYTDQKRYASKPEWNGNTHGANARRLNEVLENPRDRVISRKCE